MTQVRFGRLLAVSVVVAVSATALTACAAGTAQEVELPRQNQSQWTLPLDHYQRSIVDTTLQAQQILVQDCLAKQGYEWGVFIDSSNVRPGASWNDVHRKLFDVNLAEEFGYGNSRELARTDAEESRWRAIDAANKEVGQTATAAVDACFGTTGKKLGTTGETDPYSLAEQLAGNAYDDAVRAETVVAAERKWRSCMAPVGVADLPDSPNLMPSESISGLRPGTDAPSAIGSETAIPARERQVAVADAKCRVSSDYTKAAYLAEWDAQVDALRQHADDLTRYRRQADAEQKRAEQIIAENPVAS